MGTGTVGTQELVHCQVGAHCQPATADTCRHRSNGPYRSYSYVLLWLLY